MKPLIPSIFLFLLALAVGQSSVFAQEETARMATPEEVYYDAVKAHMLGEDKQSEALLKQVIIARPNEAAPYYDLSRLALKANDGTKATEYIKKAIELDGKNKWYHEQYANALTLRNDFASAADEYANLAKMERFNDEYLERSALLYQRAGKYKEAFAQLDVLRKKTNDNEDVLLQQQQLYLKMNDVDGAAGIVKELIAKNPKEPRYQVLLVEIYENNKQPEKAKQALEEMTRKFPSDPTLQLALADQALKHGDTAGYRSYVKKAILNQELDTDAQTYYLSRYLKDLPSDSSGRKDALDIIDQIVQQHPNNVVFLSAYGRVLFLDGQRERALEQYKKAVIIKANDFETWEALLDLYRVYSVSQPTVADSLIKYSEKAARLFPNQASVHFHNGVGRYLKKDYPAAIKAMTRAVDLEPEEKSEELAQMYSMLGEVYNSTKQYTLSDSSYNSALRLDPRNETVLNNYAYYLSVRNTRLDDAAKMSQESLKIRPGEATFLDTYGWILYQQGKYKEAIEFLKQAVDKSPNTADPTLWEHLGAAEFKIGNKDAAVAAWLKAKERGSENTSIDKMIAERRLYE